MHVTYQYVNMILVLPYSSFANINCKDEFTYDLLFASCSELFYSDCGKCSVTTRKGQIDICLPRNSRAVLMLMTSRLIASILNYIAGYNHFLCTWLRYLLFLLVNFSERIWIVGKLSLEKGKIANLLVNNP